MDEDQYRAIYHEINQQRCVFEKAINNRRCDCQRKKRFLLATREGVACQSASSLASCSEFLDTLRQGSRFALRETTIDGPLPHNRELKVQAGGCHALNQLVMDSSAESTTPDIQSLLAAASQQYGSIAALPYNELIKGVVNYQSRPRKRKRRGDS